MYICAHCGSLQKTESDVLRDPVVLDTGTTFACTQCEKDTVIVLMTPEAYRLASTDTLTTTARALLGAVDYRCNGQDRDVRIRDLWGAAYALREIERALTPS